ncbi:MAG: hypothetical protein ACPL6C_03505, partial [bacterium]
MMRRWGIILIVVSLPALVLAQAKVGTAGAQFLEIIPTARTGGMGEVYLSIADDADAIYINPGGLSAFPKRAAIFS